MNVVICAKPGDSKMIAYGERRTAAGDHVIFRNAGEDAADYLADEIVMPADWPNLEDVRRECIADGVLVTVIGVDAKVNNNVEK